MPQAVPSVIRCCAVSPETLVFWRLSGQLRVSSVGPSSCTVVDGVGPSPADSPPGAPGAGACRSSLTSSYRVSENVYLVMHICCVQWHVAVTCPLRALRRRQPRPCPPRSSFWTEIDSVCLSVFPTDPPPTSVPAARHRCRAFHQGSLPRRPPEPPPAHRFIFAFHHFLFKERRRRRRPPGGHTTAAVVVSPGSLLPGTLVSYGDSAIARTVRRLGCVAEV